MNNYLNKMATMPKMNNYMSNGQQNTAGNSTQHTPAMMSPMQMPTGYPTGPLYSTPPCPMAVPQTTTVPGVQMPVGSMDIVPETLQNTAYTQGYLKTQIGRKVKVEFLIGTNMLMDREGTLVDVGASFIIILETETDDLLLCDLYSIKFVRFYY